MALLNMLVDMLAEIEADIVLRDRGHVEAETLVNTIQYSLPEVEAQTTVDALRDMDAKASVNTLADRGRTPTKLGRN